MTDSERVLEETADRLIRDEARRLGVSIRSLGILSKWRLRVISKREIPLSIFTDERSREHSRSEH